MPNFDAVEVFENALGMVAVRNVPKGDYTAEMEELAGVPLAWLKDGVYTEECENPVNLVAAGLKAKLLAKLLKHGVYHWTTTTTTSRPCTVIADPFKGKRVLYVGLAYTGSTPNEESERACLDALRSEGIQVVLCCTEHSTSFNVWVFPPCQMAEG